MTQIYQQHTRAHISIFKATTAAAAAYHTSHNNNTLDAQL